MEYFTNYTREVSKKHFSGYRQFERAPYRQAEEAARQLAGFSVIHVNSAFNSGGVAEILKSQVPLEQSLGLRSHWLVMKAPDAFYETTKKIHNMLQGREGELSPEEQELYLGHNKKAVGELLQYIQEQDSPALVMFHDPQPLPMISYLEDIPVVSRIHVDLSNSNERILRFLQPFFMKARRLIVSDEVFKPSFINPEVISVIYPAIDVFSAKNMPMEDEKIRKTLSDVGLNVSRPIAA
ncbi:MAG: hypothetical protein ACREHG_07095, partial [Candidatus Saccharimonadales bacterium]